jgi:hypothetical protein
VPRVRGWNLGLGVAVSLLRFPIPAGLQRYYSRRLSLGHLRQHTWENSATRQILNRTFVDINQGNSLAFRSIDLGIPE